MGQWWLSFRESLGQADKLKYLVFVVLLMPLNWLLEIAKWRLLLRASWPVGWWLAARLVLAGISVSLATPNRIGEYGGRLLLAPSEQTANIIFSSIIGSLCQWVAFLICGWPALVYWWGAWVDWSNILVFSLALFLPLLLVVSLFLIPVLLKKHTFFPSLNNRKWWRWLRRQALLLRQLSAKDFYLALLLALFRFWVYSCQYLLLLWFFNVSLDLWTGVSGIFCIYLIQAGIPLPPGLGVITRSEIAILIWSSYTVEPLAVVSATFSLYIINLVLPSLLGALLLVKIREREK